MKFKKMIASVTAAAMAVTTMAIAPFTVYADEITIVQVTDGNFKPMTDLLDAAAARITFNVTDIGNGWTTLTAYTNNGGTSGWQQKSFAPTAAYEASQSNPDWEVNEEISVTGQYVAELPFKLGDANGWGYQIGLKESADDLAVELNKIELLNENNSVLYTFDPNEPKIDSSNFSYSIMTNTSMDKGDFFTISFDSDNTPEESKYKLKYVINSDPKTYPTAVDNGTILNEDSDVTGMEITKSSSGTVTTFKFTAVAPSKYSFAVNVEISKNGTWEDTQYPWFGSVPEYKSIVEDAPVEGNVYTVEDPKNIPDTIMTQTMDNADGTKNVRFVKKISVNDAKNNIGLTLDVSNGSGKTTVEITKCYSSIKATVGGVADTTVSAGDGYVFVAYTFSKVPADVTLSASFGSWIVDEEIEEIVVA